MSKIIEFNSARIDESSQILLQILVDYGGTSDIRMLRREADLEQASQIHYRYDTHLGPDGAGLMDKEGIREVDGQEMTVFSITNEGRRFLDLHEEDVLDAVGAAKAVESLNRMQEQLADFEERLDTVAEDVDETIESRYSTRFSRMQDDVEELEKSIDYLESALSGRVKIEDFGDHLDDFEEVEKRLDAVHDFVRKAEKTFENIEHRQDVLLANQLEIGAALDKAGVDVRLVDDADDIDEDRFDRLRYELAE